MPKKKARSTGGPSRKRKITLDDVHKAARTLNQQASILDGLAQVMESHRVAEIEIDGYGLLERGINELDRFIDNVDKGVSKARRDRERASM